MLLELTSKSQTLLLHALVHTGPETFKFTVFGSRAQSLQWSPMWPVTVLAKLESEVCLIALLFFCLGCTSQRPQMFFVYVPWRWPDIYSSTSLETYLKHISCTCQSDSGLLCSQSRILWTIDITRNLGTWALAEFCLEGERARMWGNCVRVAWERGQVPLLHPPAGTHVWVYQSRCVSRYINHLKTVQPTTFQGAVQKRRMITVRAKIVTSQCSARDKAPACRFPQAYCPCCAGAPMLCRSWFCFSRPAPAESADEGALQTYCSP